MAYASSSTIAVIAFGCLLAIVSVVYDQLFLLLPYSSGRRELRSSSSSSSSSNTNPERNRRLARKNYDEADGEFNDESSVYPWARTNLRRLSAARSEPENFLFWHIPKSGGSAIKAYYQCVGKIITTESHSRDILAAREAKLVESGRVDVIFSSNPNFAIQNLFDADHKGRALAVFRHPVDRLVSKFYYLQMATWEKSYSPEWKHATLLSWAASENSDNDHTVKRLAGKSNTDVATHEDLRIAKGTVRRKFVVGLTSKLEESVMRFNDVMGVDHALGAQSRGSRGRGCLEAFFGEKAMRKNSNSHPRVEEGSEEWNLLAERNKLDVELYEYVVRLFDEQKEIIDTYDAMTTAEAESETLAAAAASGSSSDEASATTTTTTAGADTPEVAVVTEA